MLLQGSSRQGQARGLGAALGVEQVPGDAITKLHMEIAHHLSQLNFESALFMSEILHSECLVNENKSQDRAIARYLYGFCLYMNEDYNTAKHVCGKSRHEDLGCAYVYARCCLKLRSQYSEALDSLLSLQGSWEKNEPYYGYPTKATICLIVGRLFKFLDHESKSESFFNSSLMNNHLLWEAAQELCSLGSKHVASFLRPKENEPVITNKPQTPFKVPSRNKQGLSNSQANSLLSSSNVTVSMSPHIFKKSRYVTASPSHKSGHVSTPPSKISNVETSRLFKTPISTKNIPRNYPDKYLEDLFSRFVKIEYCRCRYDSFKAIRMIQNHIPAHISSSMPWCLSTLGKLHFEIVNYAMAKSYFEKLRTIQPTRFMDMDIYSTVLWHLQDKKTLSYICAELLSLNKYDSIAWCAMGNLHSLNKDHDEAISAFGKAIQLDPFFAYAYTLQGHEYSNNDAFDNAKSCFRKALAIDKTHYNALYGLGMSCVKVGKFEEALIYFEKAREINPVNVILNCCCGVALERLQQPEKALKFYELATELQPSSSLALFKKSQLLLHMGQYSSALQNFEKLETLTPDEAHVHFLLGHLYQIVGKKQDAMHQYTIAMNLDPKGSQLIKEAMAKCHEQG